MELCRELCIVANCSSSYLFILFVVRTRLIKKKALQATQTIMNHLHDHIGARWTFLVVLLKCIL